MAWGKLTYDPNLVQPPSPTGVLCIFSFAEITYHHPPHLTPHHTKPYALPKSSQLREHSAWFFADVPNVISRASLKSWMGDFSNIKCVAKYAARMGQCFSGTFGTFEYVAVFVCFVKVVFRSIGVGNCLGPFEYILRCLWFLELVFKVPQWETATAHSRVLVC